MRRSRASLAGIVALATGLAIAAVFPAGDDRTATAGAAPSPRLAILSSPVGAENTDLILQPIDARDPAPPVATLHHAPGAVVRGEVLAGTRSVLVVADMALSRDLSWGASLARLEPALPAQTLVDRVYHASRPLITADRRVFVLRGRAGPDPTDEQARRGELRTDELTIDEVDPSTGSARTVHAYSGYIAHLAGSLGGEVFVYRVSFGHADIVAVDVNGGQVRALALSIPPFARDFSVDAIARALVYAQRDTRSPDAWMVERLDLASGARARISGGPRTSIIRAFSGDGRWAAFHDARPGEVPAVFALRTDTGASLPVAVPRGARTDIAGFVP